MLLFLHIFFLTKLIVYLNLKLKSEVHRLVELDILDLPALF